MINNILGSSAINTVTFQSESGDSTAVMIKYEASEAIAANLKHSSYINFKKIGFQGYNGLVLDDYTNHINIEHCYFTGGYSAVNVKTGSNYIKISSSTFFAGQYAINLESVQDIEILNNVFNEQTQNVISAGSSAKVVIDGNRFNKSRLGVVIGNTTNSIVRNNRFNILTQQGYGNMGIILSSSDVLSITTSAWMVMFREQEY